MVKKLFILILSVLIAVSSCSKNPNNPIINNGNNSGSNDSNNSGSNDGNNSGSNDGNDSGSNDGNDSGSNDGNDSGSNDGNDSGSNDDSSIPWTDLIPATPITSVNFDEMFLKFETDNKTVPTFTFFKDDGQSRQWTVNHDGTNTCYIYNAPDGESGNQMPGDNPNSTRLPVNSLKIYVYREINPFKKTVENDIEKQFYFYRYTGKALGFVSLDNFLIAVDTKTGLVFPYAVPEHWKNTFGSWAPNGWISAELGKIGVYKSENQQENFTAYKFWQYDPIGKVNSDGSVTLEQFYIDAQGNNDYKPRYTGTSPYKNIQ